MIAVFQKTNGYEQQRLQIDDEHLNFLLEGEH